MRSLSKKLRYRHTALCLRWRMIKRIPEGVIYLRRLDSNGSNHGYTSGAGRYFLSVPTEHIILVSVLFLNKNIR